MTRRVTIRAIARAQIVEAFNRYNLSPAKRGDDFLNAVDARIEDLVMLPSSCSPLFGDVRRAMLKGFSYHLLYAVRERNGEPYLVILGCVHERSDPQSWRKLD